MPSGLHGRVYPAVVLLTTRYQGPAREPRSPFAPRKKRSPTRQRRLLRENTLLSRSERRPWSGGGGLPAGLAGGSLSGRGTAPVGSADALGGHSQQLVAVDGLGDVVVAPRRPGVRLLHGDDRLDVVDVLGEGFHFFEELGSSQAIGDQRGRDVDAVEHVAHVVQHGTGATGGRTPGGHRAHTGRASRLEPDGKTNGLPSRRCPDAGQTYVCEKET